MSQFLKRCERTSLRFGESRECDGGGGEPATDVTRRICFLLNNMTESNLTQQAREIACHLPHQSQKWLANLLLSRLATEPNLYDLYAQLVTQVTIRHHHFGRFVFDLLTLTIDELLSPQRAHSPEDARKLKHLGAFLGRLTLARDVPLCVDLKILVFNASRYRPASLDYLVPFICEILKQARQSQSMSTESPWLKEILQVLKELHQLTDRLPLQFEVELLFAHFSLDLDSLNPAFYLRQVWR